MVRATLSFAGAQEQQIGDLLHHLKLVGNAAGPEGIPNTVDLILDFAGDHGQMYVLDGLVAAQVRRARGFMIAAVVVERKRLRRLSPVVVSCEADFEQRAWSLAREIAREATQETTAGGKPRANRRWPPTAPSPARRS